MRKSIAVIAVIAVSALGGCAIRRGVVTASESGMSCAEASRVGRGALLKMGYAIASSETAAAANSAKITATKSSGWSSGTPEPGSEYTAVVRIQCSDAGASFAASTDEPFPASLTFRRDFPKLIATVAEQPVQRSTNGDPKRAGLLINVEPQTARQARAALGADLTLSDVTPV